MVDPESSDSTRQSLWKTIACASGTAQDRKNQYWFVAWCLTWAIVFTGANWVLKTNPDISTALAWTVAITPTAIGLGAVRSYMKFLRMADELLRKMQVDGLAVGFGVGIVFALGYQAFERAGAPSIDLNDFVLVMVGGWMAGQLIAFWRYQ